LRLRPRLSRGIGGTGGGGISVIVACSGIVLG
jgi:hypothetical protein